MAKTELVGLMECPDCGHPDAEVRKTKTKGWAFRYCPECTMQGFTKSEEGSARMIAKARPKPPAVKPSAPPPVAPPKVKDAPVQAADPPPIVTRRKSALDDFFNR